MRDNKALGLILTEEHSHSLGALCDTRTTSSIPFGARYRLIDFMLTNMVYAGIWDVGVFTRNKYESLMNHLGNGSDWELSRKHGGLTLLPPFVSDSGTAAYRGEVEALITYKNYITDAYARYVVIADADIVGKVDIDDVISKHSESGANITVVCQKATTKSELGNNATVFSLCGDKVVEVTIGARFKGECQKYMGIMVIEKATLLTYLEELSARNLYSIPRDLLQAGCKLMTINAVEISGCVKIENLDDYYKTSMKLLDYEYRNSIFSAKEPVLTRVRDEVPVRYGADAVVKNSLVADGAVIEGTVENSIIFRKVKVNKGAVVKNCILMEGCQVDINTQLSYVIADRRCYIGGDRIITGLENYPVVLAKESIV